jgi:hypothetical protein
MRAAVHFVSQFLEQHGRCSVPVQDVRVRHDAVAAEGPRQVGQRDGRVALAPVLGHRLQQADAAVLRLHHHGSQFFLAALISHKHPERGVQLDHFLYNRSVLGVVVAPVVAHNAQVAHVQRPGSDIRWKPVCN